VDITFLGSGGAFTDYRVNYHNNALVWTSEGPVLLDCGTTACQSMRELGVHPGQIRAVIFTHLHADHASPEQLAWQRFYDGPDGAPGFLRTPLHAPASLLDPLRASLHPFMDAFTDHQGNLRTGGVDHVLAFHRDAEVVIGGVRFRWFRVPHVTGGPVDKAAFGIDIDDGTTRVIWSGDTTFSPAWIRAAAEDPRVARIFHECLFVPPFKGTVHTHYEELCALPPEIRQRITLMHHTAVPENVELDKFHGAAQRHERFELLPPS
jgi:ribonuclease BN (tRNA processing enzyme)